MKILYLYDRMKFSGPGHVYTQMFVDFLQRYTFIEQKYALVSDEFGAGFANDDRGTSEIITASDFLQSRYDTIIQSGPLFQSNGLCRIDESTLHTFWKKGGAVLFLWHIADFQSGTSGETEKRLERTRSIFGKSGHGQVSIYTPPGEGHGITGIQGRSSRVKIAVTDKYLNNFNDELKDVYSDIKLLVVEKPINLGPFCRWLCIGDQNTWMLNSLDLKSNCPPPLVWGGMSFGNGICAAITGHFVNDYVLKQDKCDNVQFAFNLLNHFSDWQRSFRDHIAAKTVFISYSHHDKQQVDIICEKLLSAGVGIWRDEKEIKVGQSITGAVEDGLRKTDYFLLVLSANSVKSSWVEIEYRTALSTALKRKRLGLILPVVLDGIPVDDLSIFLGDRKYADCTDLESGVRQILEAISM